MKRIKHGSRLNKNIIKYEIKMDYGREVSKEEFFEKLKAEEAKGQDIMPHIINQYCFPYTGVWKERRTDRVFGYDVDYRPEGKGMLGTRYYLK